MSIFLASKDDPIFHQVAIAGRVIDSGTNQPVSGALVELTSMPNNFRQHVALKGLQHGDIWQGMCNRPDRTLTAIDGFFHFIDLPNGKYQLTAFLPKFSNHYDRQLMCDRNLRCYVSEPITVIIPTDKAIQEIALPLTVTAQPSGSNDSQNPSDS